MTTPPSYTITIELPHWTGFALAQLLKRICYSTVREHAVDDEECSRMMNAIAALQQSMADQGLNPR